MNTSLALTAGLLLYLVGHFSHVPWTYLLFAVLGAGAIANAGLARAARNGPLPGIALAVAILNLLLVVPDLALRAVDFRFESGIDFAPNKLAFLRYKPDPVLLWRWHERYGLNSLGYPAAEPAVPKPAGRFRMMVVGDSCSWESYPDMADVLLQQRHTTPSRSLDLVNLAMPGYSSFQGRVLVETWTDTLEPDVVVVLFGWNDHWPAFGAVDAEKQIQVSSGPVAQAFSAAYERVRLFQGVARVLAAFAGTQDPLPEARVPLADFEKNLEWIGNYLELKGIPVVFLTASTSFYQLGVPPRLYQSGNFGSSAEFIESRHRAYAAKVRELAGRRGWALLDLETQLADHPQIAEIFWTDGIHYTPKGRSLIAALLVEKLEAEGLPPSL